MRRGVGVMVAGLSIGFAASSGFGESGPARVQRRAPGRAPQTYGTSYTSFARIGASEFTGMSVPGTDAWTDTYQGATNIFRRYGQSAGARFVATPYIPSGALLTYLEVDGCGGATSTVHLYLYACDYTGDCGVGGPVQTIDMEAGCDGWFADISSLGLIADNYSLEYVLRAVVDANDGSNSLAGAIVGYQLQVSPAPATASFNDVPTGDFAFQYVEALVASGITGGCGSNPPFVPPVYCPDAFVTRRQMAIFIAKALGLHWN